MKSLKKILALMLFLFLSGSPFVMSQVSVNNDGSAPDPSAMLEIKSESKGLLMPRIDFKNRPVSPTMGLLIYVTSNGPLGNGLYLFDGSEWLKISTPSFSIGQHIGGGVVFYIDSTNQHGLIVSLADQPGYYPYGCETDSIPGANGTAIGTGIRNTADIIAACPAPEIAARVCDTSTSGGYTDWFLPSRDELDTLYMHRESVGGLGIDSWYWSSTQQSTPGAWIVIFNAVPPFQEAWTNKAGYLTVRCIRKF